MTQKPDTEEMLDQTRQAAAESFAPIAQAVIQSAIAAELHRAYGEAMEDMAKLAAMNSQDWTPPRTRRFEIGVPVASRAITEGATR